MTNKFIEIENARILFRNFSGEATRYNPVGNRTFCVLIDEPGMDEELIRDGWNIKYLDPLHDGDDPQPYLQVKVSYGTIPPKIVQICGGKQVLLNEETIRNLDSAEIEHVDLVIRPYNWEVNGKTGVKAYLKTMWVTIQQDRFEEKYSRLDEDVPF